MAGLPAWVSDPVLRDTWERLAHRVERSGLDPVGWTQVPLADTTVRYAVGDLIGRPVTGGSCRIDLGRLDARLGERAGAGLVECAERVLCRELVDRPAVRTARTTARQEPFAVAASELHGSPLEDQDWVARWLGALRREGLVARYTDPVGSLHAAVRVLLEVAAGDPPPGRTAGRARTEIAARLLHDAHGLDEGRPVTRLVLRGLAQRAGRPIPADAAERLVLWESVGIRVDAVSSTCLTLGLEWRARGVPAQRTSCGPVHVTGWDLARTDPILARGTPVLVCENPRVLEAHAERLGTSRPVVCTSGRPNLVVQDLLSRLHALGADLRYHGDFDWPGIAIAHQVMDLCGATPWLMDAVAYDSAPGFLPLEGRPVFPRWDDELGSAMRRRGVAVHEEAVVDQLVEIAFPPGPSR